MSGDGFVRCGDGHVRWGVFGAAGVVFVVRESDGPKVMLQKRSQMAHEGGTWSCAGGALDQGEMPMEGALREASEEVGVVPGTPRLLGEYIFNQEHVFESLTHEDSVEFREVTNTTRPQAT